MNQDFEKTTKQKEIQHSKNLWCIGIATVVALAWCFNLLGLLVFLVGVSVILMLIGLV